MIVVNITHSDWRTNFAPLIIVGEMPDIAALVGRRLKVAQTALDLSQTAFGKAAGISQNQMSQYQSGKRLLTLPCALRLKARYGLSLDWLFCGEDTLVPRGLAEKIEREQIGQKKGANPSIPAKNPRKSA